VKVLYISYDGMTDPLGRSQVMPYLIGLAGMGHFITIVSCEKSQIAQVEKQEVEGLLENAGIKWQPLPFSTQPPGLSKVLDIFRIKEKCRQLHRAERFDIVHCRSYIASLAGLDLKKRFGVKFIFDMRGFWADERIEGGIWNPKNPAYKYMYGYFKKREKDFFQHADAVISLTYNGRRVIGELFGKKVEQKTGIIPCCTDTQLFSPENVDSKVVEKLRDDLGLTRNDFILSYLGSFGTWYMTREMIRFFGLLKTIYPHAKFLLISGDDPRQIYKLASEQNISYSDIVISRATRDMVPAYLALSDLSVFFIKPVFSKKASSPTKQAEILSMGIPLVCNAGVGDTEMLFADGKTGLMLNDFSDGEMFRVIRKIDDLLKTDPASIRAKALEFFNLDDGIKTYDRIYQEISRQA